MRHAGKLSIKCAMTQCTGGFLDRVVLVSPKVSDKERDVELSSLFKDVATIIAEKCINPGTQRPYTVSMIERALKEVHFSVDPKRGAKQQALTVSPMSSSRSPHSSLCNEITLHFIRYRAVYSNAVLHRAARVLGDGCVVLVGQALPHLKENMPIERAKMRLKIQVPVSCRDDLAHYLFDKEAIVESEDLGIRSNQVSRMSAVVPGLCCSSPPQRGLPVLVCD